MFYFFGRKKEKEKKDKKGQTKKKYPGVITDENEYAVS